MNKVLGREAVDGVDWVARAKWWKGQQSELGNPIPSLGSAQPKTVRCFENATRLINGPRRAAYGRVDASFKRVALMWTAILQREITTQEVALMMVAFKVAREAHSHNDENMDDIAGYTALLEELHNLGQMGECA